MLMRNSYEFYQYWDHLICSSRYGHMLNIIDLKYGKLVKSIILRQRIIKYQCCQDPRYILLQLQLGEFVIKDLLENKEQKYKGEIVSQNNNVVLFRRDKNYFVFPIERKEETQLRNIKQNKYIAWVGKCIIFQEAKFQVFHTINRHLMKILLNYSQIQVYPFFLNQVIIKGFKLDYKLQIINHVNMFMHTSKLNNRTKIIRRLKATTGDPIPECLISKQFAIMKNDSNRLRVLNILKATSKFIPINEHEKFIAINDVLYIFSHTRSEFMIKKYKL